MVPPALLPISNSVRFQALDQQEDHFVLKLKTKSTHSCCPDCGEKSSSRHSSYMRKLRDLPWAGIPVKVNLWVNKYYCKHESCARKIFTERLDDHLKPYIRRTARLTEHLNQIGCALGGNPGAKLAHFLGMSVSSSTILRILHNIEPEEIATPRVLGIDDWAFSGM